MEAKLLYFHILIKVHGAIYPPTGTSGASGIVGLHILLVKGFLHAAIGEN